MYKYLISLYWVSGLRVRTVPANDYAITPVCFLIDSATGMIISYSFSYGLPRLKLHVLAQLAFQEKMVRPTAAKKLYRSAPGDIHLARTRVETDACQLSLETYKYPRPSTLNWSKAGMLVAHMFYDWDYSMLNELDSFQVINSSQLVRILDRLVGRFNSAVDSGVVNFFGA
ncbi:hypothetical protein OH708_02645 [Pseudomonas capsici]|uniref:hypothetical protein n=1 Tax=Pseudomonas capsici TaxID=2810614 RepID=UPI0021F23F48|nr:hypothetical protein [Pseudomonas capsici]MCV4286798.1 hypothetical protein [Pseudomonas capsici]